MPDLFKGYVLSILVNKNREVDAEDYVPYIVNQALSYHMDTVLIANEINKVPHVPKDAQYRFLLNTVEGKKRPFQPWIKKQHLDNLEVVKEHFGFSDTKAKEALKLLTSEQIEDIKNKNNKGGIVK